MRRRFEARHGSCCRTVLRVLLLVPNFVDPKRVVEGRDDVAVLFVLAGRTLHEGKHTARELADLPAGRDVPHAHLRLRVSRFWFRVEGLGFRGWGSVFRFRFRFLHRIVLAGADDLCAVAAERYPSHVVRVPRQRAHLRCERVLY